MATNLYNTMYNPDVLSCIANLSNDEVFTPPEVANAMLDMLPQDALQFIVTAGTISTAGMMPTDLEKLKANGNVQS